MTLCTGNIWADVSDAEDVAWRMAIKYRDRSFEVHDVQQYGIMSVPDENSKRFRLRIVKGLDYVFLAALDSADKVTRPGPRPTTQEVVEFLEDLDLYVYSEVGQMIMEDRRPNVYSMAGVQFRADYNGEVDVIMHLYRDSKSPAINRPIAYYILVGSRGTPRGDAPPAPGPQGGGNTNTQGTPPKPAPPAPVASPQ